MKFYKYINENTEEQSVMTIDKRGNKFWRLSSSGQLHREDGPAIEQKNGTKEYFQYGLRHRKNGPALEDLNGNKEWWIEDKKVDLSTDIPETLQIAMIKDDPENISLIKNPTRKTIIYMINNYPWILTDNDFTRCPKDCKDLKLQWSRIGKTRKQIGL